MAGLGRHRRQHRQGEGRRSTATTTSSRRSTRAASSCSTTRARSSAGRWRRSARGRTTSPRRTLEKIKPILAKWLPLVKVYDSDSPKTALLNGDVDLGIVWSGEAALLYNEDPKFKYVLPPKGAHQFIDSLAIPPMRRTRDARHGVHELHPAPGGQQADLRPTSPTPTRTSRRASFSPEELNNPPAIRRATRSSRPSATSASRRCRSTSWSRI